MRGEAVRVVRVKHVTCEGALCVEAAGGWPRAREAVCERGCM